MRFIRLFGLISGLFICNYSFSDVLPRVACEEFDPYFADQMTPGKLNRRNGREQLERLTFKFDVIGYGPEGRVVNTVDEVPIVALPVEGGWLLGSDRGEWGGNLVLKPKKGKTKKLLEDNIEDIYMFSYGYIATAGLSHLGMDQGSIYLIDKKSYKVKKLHSLVSAPKTSWLLNNGDLLINMQNGESSIFHKDGKVSRLICSNFTEENG